ncbi:thiamine pyrophosphate-binding protein [Photobacterium leiognathi subsp. mandapamensis]
MKNFYTREKNTQIIIQLLKAHGISRVITSPGTANMAFVGSIQNDPFFECFSSVDERSAAYMACGLAEETGEPVVLTCTGATASRNYLPGLTEAYYRKLPILAITSVSSLYCGHLTPQVIDRSIMPIDTCKLSIQLPIVKDNDDFWHCEISVNRAILELNRYGGGPVHINLPTIYDKNFDAKVLPNCKVIKRFIISDNFPKLKRGNIAIFIGSHSRMDDDEVIVIEEFCKKNNAVVFCDHTSNYNGKYRLPFALIGSQKLLDKSIFSPDILIHIGEISGDYYTQNIVANEVWRVSKDGEIRDRFRKLKYVFEMSEKEFFGSYLSTDNKNETYFTKCKKELNDIIDEIPELPFSNIWAAYKLSKLIPKGSIVNLAILNSLRSWNFFPLDESITVSSNVGGFGIDGSLSTLIGSSLANPKRLCFGVIGDLALFYDMNVLGNRHTGNNIRILLINNGKGTEFRNASHAAESVFGLDTDEHIAAARHYGDKSKVLIKNYVESLGFEYLTASNKAEFEEQYNKFLTPEVTSNPILFELFTDSKDESDALELMLNIKSDSKEKLKSVSKKMLGTGGVKIIKKILGK